MILRLQELPRKHLPSLQERISTFPLAGTRPRGKTKEEDLALEKGLLADEKELAEHNMLVDLGRNDIGKISQDRNCKSRKISPVERYSHVMHLGSTVTGTIREDKDAMDAVDAILPAGTLSGAPKFRACQIIRNWNRANEAFTAVPSDIWILQEIWIPALQSAWYIRKTDEICIRSGAGIVADSVPEKEFQECHNKARAVVRAIEQAQEGLE